jgi:hypothetical protein
MHVILLFRGSFRKKLQSLGLLQITLLLKDTTCLDKVFNTVFRVFLCE